MVHHPRETGSDDPLNKTAIRKRLHFTDERHDLVTAIRKYGVFADGPALPFRDTGFWARNGVSRHGKASVSAKPARDTDFWTEKGVSRHGETAQSAKTRSRHRFLGQKWCVAAWESLCFRKTCSRYRLLDGKGCVAAWGNSSIGENQFTTGQWGRMRVGGQSRFHGCDFLLSLRPFLKNFVV